jgi:hypothetical protein
VSGRVTFVFFAGISHNPSPPTRWLAPLTPAKADHAR